VNGDEELEPLPWPTNPTVLLSPAIIWLYDRLARREEQSLLDKFGPAYRKYRQQVPMFVPDWSDLRQMHVRF
jgi:protein-S-isoprenylcysteine O-methyltransferase Ste14